MAMTYTEDEKKKKLSAESANATSQKLNGVDESTENKINSSFTASDNQTNLQAKSNSALSNLEQVTNKTNVVNKSTWNTINSQFRVPSSVQEADIYLKSQLEKIQSGRTSYTDQIKAMMSQIQSREKFSYDVDTDPLFQQALASAMNSGKSAMQDTIGQASALTGGYGSTYATSAANQAYNAYIEDAYNNLPQYYQMAMEAYQMEGDEMYRQLGMLNDADATEYLRTLNAYDATFQYRNQVYSDAYTNYRDIKTDALNSANLQLSEHGQLVNDTYNYYNASSDYANTMYGREYTKWQDEVSQAMQYAQMQNSEWWNKTNFNESVRQYEQNFAEEQRQFDLDYNQKEKWNQKDLDYKNSALAEEKRQYNIGIGDTNNDGVVSDAEYSEYYERYGKSKSGENNELLTTEITGIQKAYNGAGGGQKGYDAVTEFLKGIGKTIDNTTIDAYIASATAEDGLPVWFQTWNIVKDTTNLLGGDDGNDVYRNLNGETMTFDDLKKAINNSDLSYEEKKSQLDALRKQGKK